MGHYQGFKVTCLVFGAAHSHFQGGRHGFESRWGCWQTLSAADAAHPASIPRAETPADQFGGTAVSFRNRSGVYLQDQVALSCLGRRSGSGLGD